MASLVRIGYLDDRALAYNLASSLATRKLFGRVRVAAELKRRGIDPELARESLERAFAEVDEDDSALRAARQARGTGAGRDPAKLRERTARALARRGFSRGAIMKALRASDPVDRMPSGDAAQLDGTPSSGPDDGAIDALESEDSIQDNDDNEF